MIVSDDSHSAIIEHIYDVAAAPSRWPEMLEALATHYNAAGAVFLSHSVAGPNWVSSHGFHSVMEEFTAEGWMIDNQRTAPLISELHPGFRTDLDYRSIGEVKNLPVFRDFLTPRGIGIGAGTIIQGSKNDAIALTIEGFPSSEAAIGAITSLNALRPHLARSLSLASRVQEARFNGIADGLSAIGIPAAVIDGTGRVRAINEPFDLQLGNFFIERNGKVAFLYPPADREFSLAIERALSSSRASASVVLRPSQESLPAVFHLLPLCGASREFLGSDGLLIMVAGVSNSVMPGADLLRLLFDLTPAEARLARLLVEGKTIASAASSSGTTYDTARAQLRAIFAKTGVRRQADLISLLSSYRLPQREPL